MQVKVIIRKRIVALFLLLIAILAVLDLRIAWIQLVKGDELRLRALDNRLQEVPVEAKRGKILDRNGKELAVSISTPSIGAYPPAVRNSKQAEEIAAKLAAVLEMDPGEVLKAITQQKYFWWVKRKVTFEQGIKVKEMDLPGIRVVEESQRYYPNGSLAAHVLGIAGIDNQGLEGLEWAYEKQLRGIAGYLAIEKDAGGRDIPQAKHVFTPPVDGYTLVLTLDQTIQYIAERELDKLMQSPTNPKSAAIIVMDPKNGEILALANRPTFDPNKFREYPQKNRRNFAVSDVYEPGSTFKIITTAAALDEAVVSETERFYDPGYIKVGKEIINCWRRGRPHGSQTFVEAVQNSCNPVFVSVGLRLEEKRKGSFYEYIEGFGFGRKTGIDLNGEERGLLIAKDKLKQINVATISIGQAIAVTPIQLITAAAAVGNGGMLMRPHLVKEIRDSEGKLIQEFKPEVVRQVISSETASEVTSILERVVSRGTGQRAYIQGYRVGGKTGTAQKVENGKYVQGRYVASFLGMAPVNDPRLVVLVVIDEPQGIYYGGTVAAPLFKSVMEDSLRYLNVPPQYNPETDPVTPGKPKPEDVPVPEVERLPLDRAQAAIRAAGLVPVVEGRGVVVGNQVPKGSAKVPPGTKVILYAGQQELPPDGLVPVPDVTGRRIREAAAMLEAMGLRLVPEGSGQAVEQDPIPGVKVEQDTSVRVKFLEAQPSVETMGP
ncbi:stage V sporulation protein D [Clostridiales bacterium PH28_bin88]|nr:stage V sporulation protein D [Clostridiales bacterium PH28_bin88]